MNEVSLSQFCEGKTQEVAAVELGYSQGWISLLLKSGRNITVVRDAGGAIDIFERRLLKTLPEPDKNAA